VPLVCPMLRTRSQHYRPQTHLVGSPTASAATLSPVAVVGCVIGLPDSLMVPVGHCGVLRGYQNLGHLLHLALTGLKLFINIPAALPTLCSSRLSFMSWATVFPTAHVDPFLIFSDAPLGCHLTSLLQEPICHRSLRLSPRWPCNPFFS
jgi:hypothetical protein